MGSSSKIKFAERKSIFANANRAFSPPLSTFTFLNTVSPLKRNRPSNPLISVSFLPIVHFIGDRFEHRFFQVQCLSLILLEVSRHDVVLAHSHFA